MKTDHYNAVLFDMDGTLIDSAPGIFDAFHHTLAHYGIAAADEQLRRFLGPPLRESFATLLPAEEIEPAVAFYRAHYARRSAALTKAYPGVREMLAALKDAGFTVCLATSKMLAAAQGLLAVLGLAGYFDYVGGASADASLDTKAAVIQHVLAQPCMKGRRAVMVGDRDNDMLGAAACGLPAVGVLYGYGPRAELEQFAPQFLADSPAALCEWLLLHKEHRGSGAPEKE